LSETHVNSFVKAIYLII